MFLGYFSKKSDDKKVTANKLAVRLVAFPMLNSQIKSFRR